LTGNQKKYPMAETLRLTYQSGENDDETLEPRVLCNSRGKVIGRFQDGDYIIFYNLRGEREVELCQALLDPDFAHFPVEKDLRLNMITMIPYHKTLPARIAFNPEEEIRETLSEVLSRQGLKQVKISESEKAIHVSFFLNGKIREPFPGEERIAVPTPKEVPFFDQKPEMNAAGVADAVIEKLQDEDISFFFPILPISMSWAISKTSRPFKRAWRPSISKWVVAWRRPADKVLLPSLRQIMGRPRSGSTRMERSIPATRTALFPSRSSPPVKTFLFFGFAREESWPTWPPRF